MTNKYHDLAVLKGFHENDDIDDDGEPTHIQLLAWSALILSEWLEYRLSNEAWRIETVGRVGKPEGRLAELVDIWIRCADVLGAMNSEGVEVNECHELRWPQLFSDLIELARDRSFSSFDLCLRYIMGMSRLVGSGIIADEDMDNPKSFDEAIAIKHAYNETRPRKHGRGA